MSDAPAAKTLIVKPTGHAIRGIKPYEFDLGGDLGWEFEVRENRKYVQVKILELPQQTITYEDTLKNLRVDELVCVPVGFTRSFIGRVVALGRGDYEGDTKSVIGRYVLDATLPF